MMYISQVMKPSEMCGRGNQRKVENVQVDMAERLERHRRCHSYNIEEIVCLEMI